MPSIQQRNWQEIDEPEIYGEQREQLNERQCAQRRNLSGKLSDLDRTTDVLARTLADNQLTGAFEGVEPGSVAAAPEVLAVGVARLRAAIEDSLRSDYFLPGRLAASMTDDMFAVQPQQQQPR